jgi:hypothetical protein
VPSAMELFSVMEGGSMGRPGATGEEPNETAYTVTSFHIFVVALHDLLGVYGAVYASSETDERRFTAWSGIWVGLV